MPTRDYLFESTQRDSGATDTVFSQGLSEANKTALQGLSAVFTIRTSRRLHHRHSAGMARCIERHRRFLAAVATFSAKRTTASGSTRRAVAVWAGLTISQIRERLARRQLVSRTAVDAHEAEQKILYLIAVTVARGKNLRPAEITEIVASVEEFRTELGGLLQYVGHPDQNDNSLDLTVGLVR
jgi:2-keto-3-deoxy-galactonokinase